MRVYCKTIQHSKQKLKNKGAEKTKEYVADGKIQFGKKAGKSDILTEMCQISVHLNQIAGDQSVDSCTHGPC